MSFWSSTLHTRRRAHHCATCGSLVEEGRRSYNEAGLADGDFNSYKQCVPCHDLVARLYAKRVLDGYWLLCELPEIARDAGEIWPPAEQEMAA